LAKVWLACFIIREADEVKIAQRISAGSGGHQLNTRAREAGDRISAGNGSISKLCRPFRGFAILFTL
jgi:hypothetical protein